MKDRGERHKNWISEETIVRHFIGMLFLFSFTLAAQTKTPVRATAKKHPQSQSAQTMIFLVGPLPMSGPDFPPRFFGHNPATIFDAAMRVAKKYAKSDFETRDQHEVRLQNANAEMLTKGLRLSDTLAFTVPASTLDPTYDAETQQMTMTFGGTDDQAYAEWSSAERFVRSYTGSNSFGVKKTIREYMRLKYVVHFDHPTFISGNEFDTEVKLYVPMASDVAKRHVKTLAVALIGHLEFPFADESRDRSDPTIDHPYEVHTLEKAVHLRLEELRIFDRSTGEVLYVTSEGDFRKTHPLRVEVFGDIVGVVYVDSIKQDRQITSESGHWTRTLAGRDEIRLEFYNFAECSKVRLMVNEKPFATQCQSTGQSYLTHHQIVIKADQLPVN